MHLKKGFIRDESLRGKIRACEECGREYEPYRKGQRFCCAKHRLANWYRKHPGRYWVPKASARDGQYRFPRTKFWPRLKIKHRLNASAEAAARPS